ncbi:MAG: DUF3520 domain-containing protein, partial [Verrucomicrobia bacterium]
TPPETAPGKPGQAPSVDFFFREPADEAEVPAGVAGGFTGRGGEASGPGAFGGLGGGGMGAATGGAVAPGGGERLLFESRKAPAAPAPATTTAAADKRAIERYGLLPPAGAVEETENADGLALLADRATVSGQTRGRRLQQAASESAVTSANAANGVRPALGDLPQLGRALQTPPPPAVEPRAARGGSPDQTRTWGMARPAAKRERQRRGSGAIELGEVAAGAQIATAAPDAGRPALRGETVTRGLARVRKNARTERLTETADRQPVAGAEFESLGLDLSRQPARNAPDAEAGAATGVESAFGPSPRFASEAAPPTATAQSETAQAGEVELAPLPLKLPAPAFMGTPPDFGSIAQSREKAKSAKGAEAAGTARHGIAGKEIRQSATAVDRLSRRAQPLADNKAAAEPAPPPQSNRALKQPTRAARPAALPAAAATPAAKGKALPGTKATVTATKRLPETAEKDVGLVVPPPVASRPAAPAAPEVMSRLPAPAPTPPPAPAAEALPEVAAAENPFSTFSLNVSDVSFRLAAAALDQGRLPDPATVRSEEFVNAFDYRDPEPPRGRRVGLVWERARYPFAHNREVIRFSIKTAATGRAGGRPLNLVVLLDSSGSMERADRVRILRQALKVLGEQLRPGDRLSIVTFASSAHLLADGVQGDAARKALARASEVPPQGGTNLEDALRLAYQTALRHYLGAGINRVVLLTDGAANLGNVDPEALQRMVEEHRQRGVALDAFGVGWEGYNDELLETLTRHGDGRYGFLNTPEEAAEGFARQLAGALQVAAADVKVQVEFNPARVVTWRQVGFEKHRLTKEQFRDNTVDAAEIGAAEAGNALYLIQPNPDGHGPIGWLRVRYRVPETGRYEEHEWPLVWNGPAPRLEHAPPSLRLAAVAAAFAEWLVQSPFAAEVTPDRLLALLQGVPEHFAGDPHPATLQRMIQQARRLVGAR